MVEKLMISSSNDQSFKKEIELAGCGCG